MCKIDDFRVSRKFLEKFDAQVLFILKQAQERCAGAKRRTLLAQDV